METSVLRAATAAAALMGTTKIDLRAIGPHKNENPYVFAPVVGRNKNRAVGDRALNRSKYQPHQGAAECARRARINVKRTAA